MVAAPSSTSSGAQTTPGLTTATATRNTATGPPCFRVSSGVQTTPGLTVATATVTAATLGLTSCQQGVPPPAFAGFDSTSEAEVPGELRAAMRVGSGFPGFRSGLQHGPRTGEGWVQVGVGAGCQQVLKRRRSSDEEAAVAGDEVVGEPSVYGKVRVY